MALFLMRIRIHGLKINPDPICFKDRYVVSRGEAFLAVRTFFKIFMATIF